MGVPDTLPDDAVIISGRGETERQVGSPRHQKEQGWRCMDVSYPLLPRALESHEPIFTRASMSSMPPFAEVKQSPIC